MSLLVLLTSMTYWFYGSSLETRARGTQRGYKLRLARVTLDRIAREIRQASVITADGRVGIRGEAERIWLSTLRVPSRELSKDDSYREEPPPAEYDLVKIEYKIVRHPEILHEEDGYERALGLARVEHLIPRPDSAQTGQAFEDEQQVLLEPQDDQAPAIDDLFFDELYADEEEQPAAGDSVFGPQIQWEELYASEIRYLRLCYYDGYKWWDDWNVVGENPLPQLVLVTIGFEEHCPFGEELGLEEKKAEEFCSCLNEDETIECLSLDEDQFATVVRVPQADPFFRSRVTREAQALIEDFSDGAESEGDEESGGGEQ
jgi:hypothetical protein